MSTHAFLASRVDRDRKVAELAAVTHASVGVLSAHIEGFDGANVPRNPSVPLDALRDANRIEEVLRLQGAHISGGEHVLAELQQSIATAGAAIEATHDGRVAVQSARADLRATARELHRLLVAFRLVLRVTLGRHHDDYQRMRNLAASLEPEPPEGDEGDEVSEVDTQPPA